MYYVQAIGKHFFRHGTEECSDCLLVPVAQPGQHPPPLGMNWVVATLVSAFFLGVYELAIKHAVRDNAVLPVLFLANVCSAAVWLTLLAIQRTHPAALPEMFLVAPLSPFQHAQLFLKSFIVAASWVCTYFAVKHLPLSIASPIRASAPIWTTIGALVFLAERPSLLELLGVAITLASFVLLSLAGRREGVHFHTNQWVWWSFAGAVLGATSMLYDKYLLGRAGYAVSTVQAWFVIYLAVLFLPLAVGWKYRWWQRNPFHWRWSVLLLSISLLIADFVYFTALRDPHALVSLVSSLRRGSTLVAFGGSILFYGEHQDRWKFLAVVGVLGGIALTLMG